MMTIKYIAAISLTICTNGALAQASFDANDENNDGKISKDEFYGIISDAGIFPDLDRDQNGLIDESEYDALELDDSFADWDQDSNAYLGADEFYDGFFTSYDDDEDADWDGFEFDDAGDAGIFDI